MHMYQYVSSSKLDSLSSESTELILRVGMQMERNVNKLDNIPRDTIIHAVFGVSRDAYRHTVFGQGQ